MTIKPSLGKTDLVMIVVSLVIGIGIFRTPAIVAGKAGSEFIFYTAWILGGVISIFGALTFAEIGSRFPAAGGFYKIFSECYHPAFAFMLNWSLVITNSFSCAGVALVGSEYIAPVILPAKLLADETSVKIIATAMVAVLFGLNFAGIRMGARAQNILSSIKILMILVFAAAILFAPAHAVNPSALTATNPSMLAVLGISLIAVFFTYGGYQQTINFGADIKNPQRNIPVAILSGMAIVITLYILINITYVSVLGFEKVQNSKLLASELAGVFFGEKGFAITSAVIFISVMGFINTGLLSNPRVYYAMADDKALPPIFKRVNSSTQVQEFALSFFVFLMLAGIFFLGTIEKIINYVMFIDAFSLVAAAATIFIFRKKMAGMDYKGFRVRFFPWIPIVFILMQMSITYYVFDSDENAAIFGIFIFTGGLPLFYFLKWITRTTRTS